MRTAMIVSVGMVMLATSFAARADDDADQKFCASLASFNSDVAELNAIGPHSTVAELRAATDRVENDARDMNKAAKKMKTPTAKQFTAAMKQLKEDVDKVPTNATLDQVQTQIRADIDKARMTGRQLATESGCPQPPQDSQ